jgi:hypothetical protein
MTYDINPSPGWLAQLGFIDDCGPEVSPAEVPAYAGIVAVRLKSGRVHLMLAEHLRDLPAIDPAVSAVIIGPMLIDDAHLLIPKALKA